MNKILETIKQFIDKNYHILIMIFALFVLYNTFNTDDELNDKLDKIIKQQELLISKSNKTDSLILKLEKDLFIKYEIEALKTSKHVLYDWNAVVRTSIRPDDKMIEYDNEIKLLENKLK